MGLGLLINSSYLRLISLTGTGGGGMGWPVEAVSGLILALLPLLLQLAPKMLHYCHLLSLLFFHFHLFKVIYPVVTSLSFLTTSTHVSIHRLKHHLSVNSLELFQTLLFLPPASFPYSETPGGVGGPANSSS